MKNALRALPILSTLLVASPAFSAQQGLLGSTSTATYQVTANGPATPRLVQILNVSDVTITNATRSERDPLRPGIGANACVVDTYGGAVSLTVSNAGASGTTADAWLLKAASGETLPFRSEVTDVASNVIYGGYQPGSDQFVASIPATVTVNSAGNCGAGNIRLHSFLYGIQSMPETFPARSYVTTITIVASPI